MGLGAIKSGLWQRLEWDWGGLLWGFMVLKGATKFLSHVLN